MLIPSTPTLRRWVRGQTVDKATAVIGVVSHDPTSFDAIQLLPLREGNNTVLPRRQLMLPSGKPSGNITLIRRTNRHITLLRRQHIFIIHSSYNCNYTDSNSVTRG